jgi:hypothetical protein
MPMKLVRPDHAPAVLMLATLAACAHDAPAPPTSPSQAAPELRPPDVPEAIRAPAGQSVIARVSAQGSQIYECQTGEDAGSAWKLVGPDAVLTDAAGAPAGRHYAGPTWEAPDGSKVVGVLVQKSDAPTAGAIPWLLLAAKSTAGAGKLANVTSIQRVDTVGGVAPATGCDAGRGGNRQSVPYRATYYFYARTD